MQPEIIWPGLVAAAVVPAAVLAKIARPDWLRCGWPTLAWRLLFVAVLGVYAMGLKSAGELGAGEAGAAVLIVDCSASMSAPAGAIIPFEAARGEAWRIVSALPPGWRFQLLAAGRQPRVLLAEFSAYRPAARSLLAALRPGAERADLAAAVAKAGELLAAAGEVPTALFLISDNQRSNLADADFSALPAGCRLFFTDAAGRPRDNRALDQPALSPSRPMIGQEVTVSCRLLNLTGRALRTPVYCRLEGAPTARTEAAAEPFAAAPVSFRLPVNLAGDLRAEIWLPDDAQPGDDRLYLVVPARPRRRLAAVGNAAPALADLMLRFAPAVAAESFAALPAPLAADTVALADSRPLAAAELDRLAGFVADGGVLLAFLVGPGDVANAGALLERRPGGRPLPWAVPAQSGARPDARRLHLASTDSDLLAGLDRDRLAALTFHHWWAVNAPPETESVVLEYDDGTPALAAAPAGAGRIILANFSPLDPGLPPAESPPLPALLQRLAQAQATGRRGAAPVRPGEPLPAGGLAAACGFFAGDSGLVAVNADPRESDLRPLDPAELERRPGPAARRRLATGETGRRRLAGGDLSWLPLLAFLVLAAAEGARLARGKGANP